MLLAPVSWQKAQQTMNDPDAGLQLTLLFVPLCDPTMFGQLCLLESHALRSDSNGSLEHSAALTSSTPTLAERDDQWQDAD